MGFHFKDNNKRHSHIIESYELEDLNITIDISKDSDGSIVADIFYGTPEHNDDLSRGIFNGIYLCLTALLTEGFKDVLLTDKEKLSAAIDLSLKRIPSMVELLKELYDQE